MKFAFIKESLGQYPVDFCCEVLEVSRAGYYAWHRRPASVRQERQADLVKKIQRVRQGRCRSYGSPRVHQALAKQGEKVCENTVARVMRSHGIRAKIAKRFVPRTTDSRHSHPVFRNVLDRDFTADRPDRKWAADITCVPTKEGWLYLAGVIDLCSRKIVGWAMADHMETDLVAEALKMALIQRDPKNGLLHHSDRGVQYASDAYQHLLSQNGIAVSMSGKGDCWDNAVMESFWSTLKSECVNQEDYQTRQEAAASIFEYIEVFYNRERLHSSLGYLSPEAFEASLN